MTTLQKSNLCVSAGGPFPLDDDSAEDVSLDALLIKNPNATFLLKIEGDSLAAEEGIYSGDIAVVDRSHEARPTDLVLAMKDEAFIVRRLSDLKKEENTVSIWGVVVAAVRIFRL